MLSSPEQLAVVSRALKRWYGNSGRSHPVVLPFGVELCAETG